MPVATREIPTTVLVVGQQSALPRLIKSALDRKAYRIYQASSGLQAVDWVGARNPNLILVETPLPDMSCEDLIRSLRARSDTPIIAISEERNEASIVGVLEAGANDCVCRPFGVRELVARAKAKLRTLSPTGEALPSRLVAGPLEIDFGKRQLFTNGRRVHLTPKEYRILAMLLRNVSSVVSHDDLIREVGGSIANGDNHGLRVYIGYLRRKLAEESDGAVRILNESRIGYKIVISG